MVVLAQALVSRPKIVLVDELSLGLAPVVVKRLVPTLESVAASGVGVLLIEQFAHVALALAQTAYVIEGGRIRYHGPAKALKDDPELLRSAYLLRDIALDGSTGTSTARPVISPPRSASSTSFTESSGCVCVFSVEPAGAVQLQQLVEVDPACRRGSRRPRARCRRGRRDGTEIVPP